MGVLVISAIIMIVNMKIVLTFQAWVCYLPSDSLRRASLNLSRLPWLRMREEDARVALKGKGECSREILSAKGKQSVRDRVGWV